MRSKYSTFLYSECKRSSNVLIDSQQINDFIDSPAGQKGFKLFCDSQPSQKAQPRPKSAKQLLTGYEHE